MTFSSVRSNNNLKHEYILGVLHGWRSRLETFLPQNIERTDAQGNAVRNNSQDGVHIQSHDGHYIKLAHTPASVLELGKTGGDVISISDATKTLPEALRSCSVDQGVIRAKSFCLSHGGITSGKFRDDSSLVLDREKVVVGELCEVRRLRYPVSPPPTAERKLPHLQGITMHDLLPSDEEFKKTEPQTACDNSLNFANGQYKNHLHERTKIRGDLFIENPNEYENIRRALIIAGEANPEIVTICNTLIHDGRHDVCISTNNAGRQQVFKNSPLPKDVSSQQKMNCHFTSNIRMEVDLSAAAIFVNDSKKILFKTNSVVAVAHEMGHVYQDMFTLTHVNHLLHQEDEEFDEIGERDVVEGIEARTLEGLCLPQRDNHGGLTYATKGSVTSTEPRFPEALRKKLSYELAVSKYSERKYYRRLDI